MIRATRALAAALALSATALAATGCGSDSSAADGGSSRVTLTLGDQAGSLRTLVNASGALKDAPYTVKWAEFEGAAPLFQAVRAGAADTSYSADLPALQALSGGVPIKAVAALRNDGRGVGIVVGEDSPVKKVSDLKGRKVVVSSARGSIAEYLLANALKEAGLSYSDVDVQYLLPTDAQAGFAAGKLDVWATFGVYQVVALQQGGRLLVDGAGGRVSGYGLIGATDRTLKDERKSEALSDALGRVGEALEWGRTHPEEYAEAIRKENGASPGIADTLARRSYGELLPVTPEVTATVQKVADTMNGIGVLDPNVDVAASVDTSLLKQ